MKILIYADDKFKTKQQSLQKIYSQYQVFDLILKTREDLITIDFYQENKRILDESIGGGYWLWKPYFILQELVKLETDEILCYTDAGDIIHPELCDLIPNMMIDHQPLFLIGSEAYENRNCCYTKKKCFERMDCNNAAYWDSPQLEAGISFWKNNDFNIKILKEWLEYCKDYEIISNDLENESPEFKAPRNDQSVLTNVAIKYNLPSTTYIRNWVECGYEYFNMNNIIGRTIEHFMLKHREDLNV